MFAWSRVRFYTQYPDINEPLPACVVHFICAFYLPTSRCCISDWQDSTHSNYNTRNISWYKYICCNIRVEHCASSIEYSRSWSVYHIFRRFLVHTIVNLEAIQISRSDKFPVHSRSVGLCKISRCNLRNLRKTSKIEYATKIILTSWHML